jgi:hypothetical protein
MRSGIECLKRNRKNQQVSYVVGLCSMGTSQASQAGSCSMPRPILRTIHFFLVLYLVRRNFQQLFDNFFDHFFDHFFDNFCQLLDFFILMVVASCRNKYYGTNFISTVPTSLLIAPGPQCKETWIDRDNFSPKMSPEGLYAYQFDPHGQEVDTRRYLEIIHISFKYQCLHKRVGHVLYEKLHFPKNRKKMFSLISLFNAPYIMPNWILSWVYFITCFCQTDYLRQKRLLKAEKGRNIAFWTQINVCKNKCSSFCRQLPPM